MAANVVVLAHRTAAELPLAPASPSARSATAASSAPTPVRSATVVRPGAGRCPSRRTAPSSAASSARARPARTA